MKENLKSFLENSPISENIKLDSRIIINRTNLTPLDIFNIKQEKEFLTIRKDSEICELEVGGQVLATGKIISKKGKYFFKVKKVSN